MKTKFYSLVLFFITATLSLVAQTDNRGFNFQGYAVSPDGVALSTTSITARFTIYDNNNSATKYEEEQTFTTDIYGVFNAIIGSISSAEFQKLNFSSKSSDFFLKVEVKKSSGGTYTTISDARMQAVPYARYAANGVPVGTIVAFAGDATNVPEGWLLCNGAPKSTTEYKQLYDVIGYTWGGSGSSFNLPDLRGRFLRGVDDRDPAAGGLDADGARTVGTYQAEAFLAHKHTGNTDTDGAHNHNNHETARADNDDNDTPHNFLTYDGANYYQDFINITSSGSSHSHHFTSDNTGGNETRPDNAAVYYIIKY